MLILGSNSRYTMSGYPSGVDTSRPVVRRVAVEYSLGAGGPMHRRDGAGRCIGTEGTLKLLRSMRGVQRLGDEGNAIGV